MTEAAPSFTKTAVLQKAAKSGTNSPSRGAAVRHGGMARLSPGVKLMLSGVTALDRVAPELATELMLRRFLRPRRRPGWDYRARLPAGAQRLNFRFREQELAGWSWGFSGPSILLVHGWEDNSGSMLGFVEPLLQRGFRVCAIDAPGHGFSTSNGTHLHDTSLALELVAHTLGRFDGVVAHSYGAAALSLMLARRPDLQPSRLTMISPMQDMNQHLHIFTDIARLPPERALRLRHRLEAMLGQSTDDVCTLRALSKVNCPGLVIHDRHDPVIPQASGLAVARHWNAARFVSTDRLGHRRVLACREVIEQVLHEHLAGGSLKNAAESL